MLVTPLSGWYFFKEKYMKFGITRAQMLQKLVHLLINTKSMTQSPKCHLLKKGLDMQHNIFSQKKQLIFWPSNLSPRPYTRQHVMIALMSSCITLCKFSGQPISNNTLTWIWVIPSSWLHSIIYKLLHEVELENIKIFYGNEFFRNYLSNIKLMSWTIAIISKPWLDRS